MQSALTAILLRDLSKDNDAFISSDFYSNMPSDFPSVKAFFRQDGNGIGNQGTMLMELYALLVIPKELIGNQYQQDYALIDLFISNLARNMIDTYPAKNQYIRHFRNSVSHARVEFDDTGKNVTFNDTDNNNHSFTATFDVNEIETILLKLLEIHIKYIADISNRNLNMP